MPERAEIAARVAAQLRACDCIRAAWLGGSDATGRADERSDIDLGLFCASGATAEAIDAIRAAIRTIAPMRLEYRLPRPTWHGFEQGFCTLEGEPEERMIDWVLMEAHQPHPWFEVERHGNAVILFDKDGLVREAHVDQAAIRAAVARKIDDLRVRIPLFRHLAAKFARRGRPVDAVHFHHALVVRPLVDLLRCAHAPDRHDFGLRDLDRDLPPAVYARVPRLAYPRGAEDLEALGHEAALLFEETVSVIESRGGPPDARPPHPVASAG